MEQRILIMPIGQQGLLLYVGTCGYECTTGIIALELLEVVDEHLGELVGLGCPFRSISISVAGIKDAGVNARKLSGNLEVEDGELLGGRAED